MASSTSRNDDDKSFCNSYLLLSPERVGFVDLFRILFSTSLEHRKFVDSSSDSEGSFSRRWIIFVSIIAQKLLLSVSKPLSIVGSAVEMWLNLVRINGSLGSLLLNFIRGNVLMPDKASADFLSSTGNLDRRMDFDENIRPGEEKYYAQLCLMSSKASYENEAYIRSIVTNHWEMEFLGCYNFWNEYLEKPTTQAFMLRHRSLNMTVVAFRGTEPFNAEDWSSDFDISWYEIPGMGAMHGGFMKALGMQRNSGWPREIESPNDTAHPPPAYYYIKQKLRDLLREDSRCTYVVTGHSLGGALAVLFPAILALHEEKELLERLKGVYTFGQPRVGDGEFGEFMGNVMSDHKIGYHRFVYGNDMVPRLPYDNSTFLFKHFGKCQYYDRHYSEQILEEEPNKNYFSIKNVIPMMITAMYELVRSFTIASSNGADYRESTWLRLQRVMGLLIPGVPAHSPMDYNNSIRLSKAVSRDNMTIKEKAG